MGRNHLTTRALSRPDVPYSDRQEAKLRYNPITSRVLSTNSCLAFERNGALLARCANSAKMNRVQIDNAWALP